MSQVTVRIHYLPGDMPDADTDCLIFAEGDTEAQLGAYVGEHHRQPIWIDAQGEDVPKVIAWCALPVLPAGAPA